MERENKIMEKTMEIIDAHVHLTYDGNWFNSGFNASWTVLQKQMDAARIFHAIVIPLPTQEQRIFCKEISLEYPDRLSTGFTLMNTSNKEFSTFSDALLEGWCHFLKVHPRMTGIPPLSPELKPFFDKAVEMKVPVIFDTYIRGNKLSFNSIDPWNYDLLARRYPEMIIVMAHAGAGRILDAIAVAQTHENVYLDISHIAMYFKGTSVENDLRFALKKLDRKIVYGSDFPEYSLGAYLRTVKSMLSKTEENKKNMILNKNASKIYKIK